jgi:sulfatase maturation enzyme AslB (radical SAM superfamily)
VSPIPDLDIPYSDPESRDSKEMMAVDHAISILKSLGTKNLHPKFFMYAEIVSVRGVIKFANNEFFQLVRAKSNDEVLGRASIDFIPSLFTQWLSYVHHREMLASEGSTVVFENIMARCDGTVFKCIVNWNMSFDNSNVQRQDLIQIHLDSVEDLPVEALETRLEFGKPKISFEIDYADSPPPCEDCN